MMDGGGSSLSKSLCILSFPPCSKPATEGKAEEVVDRETTNYVDVN